MKLHDKIELELNRVTPKALKNFQELGIDISSEIKTEQLIAVYKDGEKLLKLIETVFVVTDKDVVGENIDEVDLKVVSEAVGKYFL